MSAVAASVTSTAASVAVFSGAAAISASVVATFRAKVLGEDWTDTAAGDETWTDVSSGNEVWTDVDAGSEVWRKQ